jgi:hypothetical protein
VSGEVITCDSCGRDKVRYRNSPWDHACWKRWDRAGRPDTGPPPRRTGRYGEFFELTREQHYSLENAAARMRVSVRTARRYEARLRREGAQPITFESSRLGVLATRSASSAQHEMAVA